MGVGFILGLVQDLIIQNHHRIGAENNPVAQISPKLVGFLLSQILGYGLNGHIVGEDFVGRAGFNGKLETGIGH